MFLQDGRAPCSGTAIPFQWRRRRAGGECVQCFYGILRLGWTRAVWRRRVLWQTDVLLLGGLNVCDGRERLFALVGGRVVGLLELLFMVVFHVLLLLRVGIGQ